MNGATSLRRSLARFAKIEEVWRRLCRTARRPLIEIEIEFAYHNGDEAVLKAKNDTSSTAC